jgi:glyoxylase I family protein
MRVHHLALRTADLARLERFYVEALGLAVIRRQDGGRSVWLDAGGAIVMLERSDDGEPPIPAGSKELVAFTVAPETRASCIDRLAGAGVSVEASTEYSIYVRDPDGRRVGVSSYPVPLV